MNQTLLESYKVLLFIKSVFWSLVNCYLENKLLK